MARTMSDRVTQVISRHVRRGPGATSVRPSDLRSSVAPGMVCSWRLQRSGDSAHCVLRALGDRVELHIAMSDEVVMSQQCRDREEASAVAHAWWSALLDRGWVEQASDVTVRAKRERRANSTGAPHRS